MHILITSGPTRQYLDPVRFISNASSGRMGCALAAAAIAAGHEVTILTGPVDVTYPAQARIVNVTTTDEMLAAAQKIFPHCGGVIGVAAPCDYKPHRVATSKIAKTGEPILLELVETPDVIASLGQTKRPGQWVVGFALETDDPRMRALRKMEAKNCDLMILNAPSAIDSPENSVEVLSADGATLAHLHGPKTRLGEEIFALIEQWLMANG